MSTHTQQRMHLLFLTAICGLGGLLYGIDIGIIDPALPYLHRATSLTEGQLSLVVAAVMAGSILGSVVAGASGEWTSEAIAARGRGVIQPIPLGPALMVSLDQQRRKRFLDSWGEIVSPKP